MDRNTKHTTLDCGDMYEYYLTTIRVRMDTGSHILYSSRVNSPFVPSWYLEAAYGGVGRCALKNADDGSLIAV